MNLDTKDTLSLILPAKGKKITHLAIGAHPDDVEIFAFQAIFNCYAHADANFAAVVCSNGSGAPKYGKYANLSSEEVVELRRQEQIQAARVGQYASLIHFKDESSAIKDKVNLSLKTKLTQVIGALRPDYIYTHNPFDQHETHRAVCRKTIEAIKASSHTPKQFVGCEVWGSLDWLPDAFKIILGENKGEALQKELLQCFVSQNEGSQKQYDLGTLGRKKGNATFYESTHANTFESQTYALDLLPALKLTEENRRKYFLQMAETFMAQCKSKLNA